MAMRAIPADGLVTGERGALRDGAVIVAEDGRIVERGTHEDLLQNGGLYADLYRRQFASG